MNLIEVRGPEIPKDGWFHDHLMKVLLGKELMELENYPLKKGTPFAPKHHEPRGLEDRRRD